MLTFRFRTPYDMAWSSILCFQGTPNAARYKVDELLEFFPSPDACEERREFTRLHKVVLGLLPLPVEQEIQQNHDSLNRPDADGRTALQWACARGDEETTALLLRYGADPNKVDCIGQGPLRASLKANTPGCLRLLLADKAIEVDIRDNWGQTCLIATNYYPSAEHFIPHLLAAGADVNAQDHQHATPLHAAISDAHGGNAAAVTILLRSGADPNIQDPFGSTALHTAIWRNAHKVLPLLLAESPDITLRNTNGESLLHVVARTADALTLHILTKFQLQGLDVESVEREGRTPWVIGQERMKTLSESTRDEDETNDIQLMALDWGQAFENFLMGIKWRTESRYMGFDDDSMESSDTEGSLVESWHSAMDDFAAIL